MPFSVFHLCVWCLGIGSDIILNHTTVVYAHNLYLVLYFLLVLLVIIWYGCYRIILWVYKMPLHCFEYTFPLHCLHFGFPLIWFCCCWWEVISWNRIQDNKYNTIFLTFVANLYFKSVDYCAIFRKCLSLWKLLIGQALPSRESLSKRRLIFSAREFPFNILPSSQLICSSEAQ